MQPLDARAPCTPRSPLPPRRLPDELVLMVIESCNGLKGRRAPILAALCRVANRFKAAAERALYSSVALETDADGQIDDRTPVGAILHRPHLRPYVKRVTYWQGNADWRNEALYDLVGALPNVDEFAGAMSRDPLTLGLWEQPEVRMKVLQMQNWDDGVTDMMRANPHAFSTLKRIWIVRFGEDDDEPSALPPSVTSVEDFRIDYTADWSMLTDFTAPFRTGLRRLSLSMGSDLEDCNFAEYPRLEHLELRVKYVSTTDHAASISDLVAAVRSAASLPSFSSFAIQGVLMFADLGRSSESPDSAAGQRLSLSIARRRLLEATTDLLDALPSRLEHLSLVTDCIHAGDLAAWPLGASRPSALRTLRIGGAVGYGLGGILRDDAAKGPYGALAGTLERAGVGVTTVE